MITYIVKRLLLSIPILFGVTVINFFIINLAPGSPADLFISPTTTPEQQAMIRQQMGLDKPVIVQYWNWLLQVLQGNLGTSFSGGQSVASLLASRVAPTLTLMLAAIVIAYVIAIPLGIIAAKEKNTLADYAIVGSAFAGISVPHFFLGLLVIYIFAVKLNVLPTGGMVTLGGNGGIGDEMFHLVLPAVVLAMGIGGNMVRYVRSSMIDVYAQDYIRTANAKGLMPATVTLKHAFRNALIPIITVIGLDFSTLIGGAIVTEQIFQWPGIGQLAIQSITSRDYPVLMGINLLTAIAVVVVNLLTDVAYAVADPRISY